jgi:hypothetical protein
MATIPIGFGTIASRGGPHVSIGAKVLLCTTVGTSVFLTVDANDVTWALRVIGVAGIIYAVSVIS